VLPYRRLSCRILQPINGQRKFALQGKYELVVMAVDNHARDLLTSTTDVTVYVTDVNDNAPEFIRPVTSSRHVTCDTTVRLPYTTSTDAVVTQVAVTSR